MKVLLYSKIFEKSVFKYILLIINGKFSKF